MEYTYQDVIHRLADAFSELPPQLQAAARYLLENPEDVGLNSMRTVASEAGVKPATISRLTKVLGFSGYDQLREPFRQRLRVHEPGYAARLRDVQRRGVDDAHA
ncbi:MAG: MurR/RpiR family transcriptional regulator, partial [Pseudomonadales bacterium]